MLRQLWFCFLFLFSFVSLYAENIVEVKIFQTTDIHGMVTHDHVKGGAWLQLSSMIQKYRTQYPESLLIDCGDTIQGSYIASLTKGEVSIVGLQYLNYDVWVPGNHEFDFGLQRFLDLSQKIQTKALCGNLYQNNKLLFRPWKVFNRKGAKIVVIGATASYMKYWFADVFSKDCQVELAIDTLRRVMPPILALHPDMIIFAAHQGWMYQSSDRMVNEIKQIATEFPEIDLILGGHTHQDHAGQKIGSGVWYVQAGFGARNMAIITAEIDLEKHAVKKITSKLDFVEKDTPIDPGFQKAISVYSDITNHHSVLKFSPPLPCDILNTGTPGIDNAASELFCRAIAKSVDADVVFHGTLSKKYFSRGQVVRGIDLFGFVPYENTIVTAQLTNEEITTIATEQWQKRKQYTYSGIYGAKMRVLKKGKKEFLRAIRIADHLATPENPKRYKVAMNDFMASGSGRYPLLRAILDRKTSQTINTQISTRKSVQDYLSSKNFTFPPPTVWIIK
ncbi:MAG: metallophosphoesterase [Lentisphaeria bacterium]